MKKKKRNIGLYVLIITTISFVIIYLAVHFFLSNYIKNEAERSIGSCQNYLEDPDDDAYMEYIEGNNMFKSSFVDLTYAFMFYEEDYHDSVDTLVTEWCHDNPNKLDKIYLVKVRDRLCYIKQTESERKSVTYAIYTDVSSAKRMCVIVEIILVVIMLICDITATIIGYRMGKTIRDEQERQKRFFENASHELKTPLMSIQGFSEGLERGIIKDSDNAYKVIQREVGKMSRMVDEILLLSKYDRDSVKYNFEEISINELIGDVLDTFYMEIQNKGLQVNVGIEDRFIYVDIEQMHRAISNIISNAVRYAETGISIGFKNNQLAIWNDGMTLSDEDKKKMFDRFYMGEGGSTGIGLSLAKEIIEEHGYTIEADNYYNGVRFLITIKQR